MNQLTITEPRKLLDIDPKQLEINHVKPFLKWAGGKTKLLPVLCKFVPRSFSRYFEPFVGSGAMFFHLVPKISFLSDTNPDLIICYKVVKTKPDLLLRCLSNHKITEEEYYSIRNLDPALLDDVERAARFIYLNKTCYNGLYRVNKKGYFNTPYGHNKNARLIDERNLLQASHLLQSAHLECINYYDFLINESRRGDFIYFDPPYLPIGKYSDFKRYTKEFFYEADHVKLANLFEELSKRGCKLLLSNSFHNRIIELYKDYELHVVEAPRFISCKGDDRGSVKELIVINQ